MAAVMGIEANASLLALFPARMVAKIRISESGCWLWTGATNHKGYGIIMWNGRCQLVHRVAYRLTVGEIPPGKLVCHRCDTPACVRPTCFFIGTNDENMADRQAKGRQARGPSHRERMLRVAARGERHKSKTRPESVARGELNRSKLSTEQVIALRAEHAKGGVTYRDLADRYPVSANTIRLIVLRRKWAHV